MKWLCIILSWWLQTGTGGNEDIDHDKALHADCHTTLGQAIIEYCMYSKLHTYTTTSTTQS